MPLTSGDKLRGCPQWRTALQRAKALKTKISAFVELRRHHAGKMMRWTPWIISNDNEDVAQNVRNNIVGADIVRK